MEEKRLKLKKDIKEIQKEIIKFQNENEMQKFFLLNNDKRFIKNRISTNETMIKKLLNAEKILKKEICNIELKQRQKRRF